MIKRQFIFAGAAAAVLLAGGGYTFAWMRAAGAVKHSVEALLKESPFVSGEYAALKTEGFLGTLRVTLEQPKLTFNSEYILQTYFPGIYQEYVSEGTKRKPGFSDWTETLTWRDKLVIEADPFSGKATVTLGDEILHRSEIDGQVLYTTLRAAPDSHITLSFGEPSAQGVLWGTLGAEAAKSYPGFAALKGLDLAVNQPSWLIRNSSITPFKAERLQAHAAESVGGALNITGAVQDGLPDTPAVRRVEGHYNNLFNRKHETISAAGRVFNLTEGKITATAEAELASGATIAGVSVPGLSLRIKELTVKDDNGARSAAGTLSFGEKENGKRRGETDLSITAELTPGWHERLQSQLIRYASSYLITKEQLTEAAALFPAFAEWIRPYEEQPQRFGGMMAQTFFEMTPKWHELGKTEVKLTGSFALADSVGLTDVDLRSGSFLSPKYGAGFAKTAKDGQAEYKVHLTGYNALVADLTDYAGKALTARKRLNPDAPAVSLNEGFSEAASLFLAQQSAEGGAQGDDLDLTVSSNAKREIFVGGKDLFSVAGEGLGILAPFMQINRPDKRTAQAPAQPTETP